MVVEPTFLIDATFLLESAEKAFLGSTPIRNSRGQDTSVVYGAVRGLLGLRKAMGIAQGIVVIGRDAGGVSSLPNIEQFRNCLRAIGASVWHEAAYGIGPLCKEFIKQYQDQMWIISGDKSLLQLICSNCCVILIAEGSDPEVINEDSLYLRYNIRPNQVPIFFALTETSQGNRLTAKQAMRLLEVCGTAGAGFEIANPNSLSPKTRHHILANKAAWLRRLKELTITDDSVSARKVPIAPLARIDVESRNTFKEYGFPSLARHLIPTERVQLIAEHCERKSAYVAVIDRVGLLKLKDVLAGATTCAIDTESTSKDPRKAILLGVALSTEPGNAFYVPLTKPDLQNISAAEATATLQDILGQKLMIIGHNLKYDYVLLRRNGIRIATPHFDTMLAAYECFGDWDFFNLGAVAKRILNINLKRYRDIVKPSQRFEDIPFKEQLQHGCADVDATLKLYAPLRKLLKEKRIEHQFISDVMPLMNLLGDKEVDGVQVNPDALNRLKHSLTVALKDQENQIFARSGKPFDIDSMTDVDNMFSGPDGIAGLNKGQTIRRADVERFAQVNDIARTIVHHWRLNMRIHQIDLIIRNIENDRIFPLFSQLKTPHGWLSSFEPRFTDIWDDGSIDFILDQDICRLIPNENRAMEIIQRLSCDQILTNDIRIRGNNFIKGGEAAIDGVRDSSLLISLIIGFSSASICKRFLIDSRETGELKKTVVSRYHVLFRWIDSYRRDTIAAGFATSGEKRRYLEGLQSSDLWKQNKAIQSAIRWLIEM